MVTIVERYRSGAVVVVLLAAAAAPTFLAFSAVHADADTPQVEPSPTWQHLSAAVMPRCPPGGMLNVAQAALGSPQSSGPTTAAGAVAKFAVALRMPVVDALQRTLPLSDNEALVFGASATGHAVRHGVHWQADYLAVCVPSQSSIAPLPRLSVAIPKQSKAPEPRAIPTSRR